jgi:superfamily I DNA/RNA helicase
VNIFYDNAQNIFSRSTPKWSEMGLDMRGRSTIMKESFRATKPVTEFAFNLLHRLCPEEAKNADHKELVELGLVHAGKREGRRWWDILFTHIDGPSPIFKKFPNKEAEFDAIGKQLVHWIKDEGVKPSDICILYMQDYPKFKLENQVKPMLARIGVDLQVLKGQARPPDERTVIATTPHSFKGYDSEIVLIPSVEFFESGGKPLARVLYVAMTRARSLLAIYGKASKKEGQREIVEALDECLDALEARPPVEAAAPESDEHEDILLAVGIEFKKWLDETKRSHRLIQEPMLASDGTILCEPLFWYESDGRRYVCFPKGKPSQRIKNALEDARVTILEPKKD